MQRYSSHLPILIVAIVGILLSLPSAPSLLHQDRDGGQFATMALMVTEGAVSYRDFFHDKTPGVHYIQALAFLILGPNRWAIWVLQTIYLSLTCIIVWFAVRQFLSAWWALLPAGLTALIARMPYFSLDGDLLTEGYTLLPQAFVLLLGIAYINKPTRRNALLIGIASACIFVFRQNAISLPLAFVPAIVVTQFTRLKTRAFWLDLTLMIVGGLSILGLVALFFVSQGAADAFRLASTYQVDHRLWRYGSENIGPLAALAGHRFGVFGVVFLNPPLFLTALLSTSALALTFWREQQRREVTIILWILLAVSLDLILSNLSGTSFPHYYIAMAITIAMLFSLSCYGLIKFSSSNLIKVPWLAFLLTFFLFVSGLLQRIDYIIFVGSMIVLALLLSKQNMQYQKHVDILSWVSVMLAIGFLGYRFVEEAPLDSLLTDWAQPAMKHPEAVYIEENTEPDQRVLVWGYKPSVLFQANRLPPGRYTYHHPTVTPGYTDAIVPELIADMEAQQAPYIVDTAIREGSNIIPPLDAQQRTEWFGTGGRHDTGDLSMWFAWVEEHCTVEETFGSTWIYRCDYE